MQSAPKETCEIWDSTNEHVTLLLLSLAVVEIQISLSALFLSILAGSRKKGGSRKRGRWRSDQRLSSFLSWPIRSQMPNASPYTPLALGTSSRSERKRWGILSLFCMVGWEELFSSLLMPILNPFRSSYKKCLRVETRAEVRHQAMIRKCKILI